MTTVDPTVKAVSLDEQSSMVRRAFDELQRASMPLVGDMDCCYPYWVSEVYTDYVIICENMGDYYRVDYTLSADGVMFAAKDEWVKVEKDWIEAKGLEPLVMFGGSLKALGDGRIGGHLVLFGDASKTDLVGDFFTTDTDFDIDASAQATVYYQHGQDPVLKFRKLGKATLKKDEFGIWAETQLSMRDEYEQFIYGMAESGKMGWSSGVPAHLVEREQVGKAYRIKHWPLGSDASLTPTPAEPRIQAIPLKSLPISNLEPNRKPEPEAENGQPLADGATPEGTPEAVNVAEAVIAAPVIEIVSQSTDNKEGEQMPENIQEQTPAPDAPVTQGEFKALNDNMNRIMQALEKLPTSQNPGVISEVGGAADKNVKSLADFVLTAQRGDMSRMKSVYPDSYKALQEDQGATGGYLIPSNFSAELVQAQTAISPLIALCRRFPVAQPSGSWPVLDVFAAPTAGAGNTALAAGLISSTIAEGGSYTDRSISFEQINWRVTKVGYIIKVSDEMMADAPALDALLRMVITTHLSQKKERHILRGNGVGQPLGILNAPALINVTPGTNSSFTWIDVTTMLSRFRPSGDASRVRWAMSRSLLPDLGNLQVASGSAATWVQNIGTDNPDMLPLMRYGIYFSEHLPLADSSGDALLVDFGAYGLWERGEIRIGFSEHAGYTTGEIVWRFDERYDGQPLARAAITQADPGGTFTTSPFVNHND
jgi:HK97 family phage major capsid protein